MVEEGKIKKGGINREYHLRARPGAPGPQKRQSTGRRIWHEIVPRAVLCGSDFVDWKHTGVDSAFDKVTYACEGRWATQSDITCEKLAKWVDIIKLANEEYYERLKELGIPADTDLDHIEVRSINWLIEELGAQVVNSKDRRLGIGTWGIPVYSYPWIPHKTAYLCGSDGRILHVIKG